MVYYRPLDLPPLTLDLAQEKEFDVAGYGFTAQKEDTRPPRVVRVGLIQNKIVLPTTASITEQVTKNRHHKIPVKPRMYT